VVAGTKVSLKVKVPAAVIAAAPIASLKTAEIFLLDGTAVERSSGFVRITVGVGVGVGVVTAVPPPSPPPPHAIRKVDSSNAMNHKGGLKGLSNLFICVS
jgi:hypothetical protein